MKKIISIFAIMLLVVATFAQEIKTVQIAFGAIGVDSVTGGAPAGGTAKYYYFNTLGTKAGGLAAATVPISTYKIGAVSVNLAAHTSPVDSVQITIEVSHDNTNWYKLNNVLSSTSVYKTGIPVLTGAAVYTYLPDRVKFTGAASGCMFIPNELYAPYLRVKCLSFKAGTYAYVKAYVTLVKIK